MWAIRNTRTKKWLYGTDFKHKPYVQMTSKDCCLTYEDERSALIDMRFRMCDKEYEVVRVRMIIMAEI